MAYSPPTPAVSVLEVRSQPVVGTVNFTLTSSSCGGPLFLLQRWIKQAQDESLSSARDEGATPPDPSHQSSCSSSAFRAGIQFSQTAFGSNLHVHCLCPGYGTNRSPSSSISVPFLELTAPFKKRKWKYGPEPSSPPAPLLPGSSEGLLRPLSPITPPPALPADPLHTLLPEPCHLTVGAADEQSNGYSRPYSPIQSPPTSRCNTPLQFEVGALYLLGLFTFCAGFILVWLDVPYSPCRKMSSQPLVYGPIPDGRALWVQLAATLNIMGSPCTEMSCIDPRNCRICPIFLYTSCIPSQHILPLEPFPV